jgi:hypothetical protein
MFHDVRLNDFDVAESVQWVGKKLGVSSECFPAVNFQRLWVSSRTQLLHDFGIMVPVWESKI